MSIFLVPLSITDDQEMYRYAFQIAKNNTLIDTYHLVSHHLGSREPIYPSTIWFFSKFFSKDVFVICLNSLISFLLIRILIYNRVDKVNLFFFLTSFYFFTILFSLERFKLAIFFILVGITFNKKKKLKNICFIASILTHLQSIPLGIAFLVRNFSYNKKKILFQINQKLFIYNTILCLFFLILFLEFQLLDFFINKIKIYTENFSIYIFFLGLAKFIIFFVIGNYSLSKKNILSFNLIFFGLLPLFLFLQSGRVSILAYIILSTFVIIDKKTDNFIFKLFNFYFFVKGIIFIRNIILHGNGYGNF